MNSIFFQVNIYINGKILTDNNGKSVRRKLIDPIVNLGIYKNCTMF